MVMICRPTATLENNKGPRDDMRRTPHTSGKRWWLCRYVILKKQLSQTYLMTHGVVKTLFCDAFMALPASMRGTVIR